jgi:POT family proton-dependent oligopeptide transporter
MSENADKSFFGHPSGLFVLFMTELWERFSYYGMRAILLLFMVAPLAQGGLGLPDAQAAAIYGAYTGSVYFSTIPGGWIADRLLGLRRAVLIGGILIAIGHYCLFGAANPQLFFTGLAVIALGTGLLKANISSIVGLLYAEGDARRDAGFSIFYMGINVGALLSPLVCGWLAQRQGWHWGFGAAALGMTFGVIQFLIGTRRLGGVGELAEKPKNPGRLWAAILAAVVAGVALLAYAWPWRQWIILAGTLVLFAWLLKTGGTSPLETKRIGAILVLFVFATIFWVGYEQAGSSLNLFADRNTDNRAFGFSFPSSWYQSAPPFFVVTLAPLFAWLWVKLGRHEPSSPAKFAWGIFFMAIGFLVVAVAAFVGERSGTQVGPWWLVATYFFHTLGELCLYPVGLSTVTKLAPARIVGLMMGVWFLALSLGNFIGGYVAGLVDKLPPIQLFGAVFVGSLAAALLMALLVKPIKGLMGGVR